MKEYRAFAVYKQEQRPSRWGGLVWELHLVDINNPIINYHTYVSEENRNYANWRKVIENPKQGIFLETERLRMKARTPGQVNADTVFEVTVLDADKLADQLAMAWGCRRTAPIIIRDGYNYGTSLNP